MQVSVICPNCKKTFRTERVPKVKCSECGCVTGFAEMQRKRLIVDTRAERKEFALAKDDFANAEFTGAAEHFKKVLAGNANSYQAVYLYSLCQIYLHQSDDGYDLIGKVIAAVGDTLDAMVRSNAHKKDKVAFIRAMLAEIKIIITRRLASRCDLSEIEPDTFRKNSIADLVALVELFNFDREKIFSAEPEVAEQLLEIAKSALNICYKTVQTVAIGGKLYPPTDEQYVKLGSLCKEYCLIGHTLDASFTDIDYSPDFTQTEMFNDRVLSAFAKFDEKNAKQGKKFVIGDIKAYNEILSECKDALELTYLGCYRSLCSRQVEKHADVMFAGIKLIYRLLTPRIVVSNDKKLTIYTETYDKIVEYCDKLTRFVVDTYELDEAIGRSLNEFYNDLYSVVSAHLVPILELIEKNINKSASADEKTLRKGLDLLCAGAMCCMPALEQYVSFSDGGEKSRGKLVKICSRAVEDFFMLGAPLMAKLHEDKSYAHMFKISSATLDEE